VKITAVTPVAAASNPAHPDHARWVKEQTLKLEIADARALGGSVRDAEIKNTRQLERMANRKLLRAAKKAPRKIDSPEKLAATGVTVKKAKPRKLAPLPPCKLCRKCVWCKRSLRMSKIKTHALRQEPKALSLMLELQAIMMAASARHDYRDAIGRELPFSRIAGHDVDRAVTQGIEWVCDRSVSFMGQWR